MLIRIGVALAGIGLLGACGTATHPSRPKPTPVSSPPSAAAPTAARPTASPNPGGLSDEQMVGQLFITYVYGSGPDTATSTQRAANIGLSGEPTPADVVRRWHVGGIILLDHNTLDPNREDLSTDNVTSAGRLRQLTAGLQAVAHDDTRLPPLIGTDQEGGRVSRIAFLPARPAQQSLAGLPPDRLRCSYAALGRQLRNLGVNQDYAPTVAPTDVRAAVQGLQSAGVLATIKHWPGHGSTSTDSHAALAVIGETAAHWQRFDRPPFAAAVPIVDSVMVGHLALPALDASGRPATLSPVLVDEQLGAGWATRDWCAPTHCGCSPCGPPAPRLLSHSWRCGPATTCCSCRPICRMRSLES